MALSNSVMVHEPAPRPPGVGHERAAPSTPLVPGTSGASRQGMSAAIDRLATTVADLAAAVESIRTLSTAPERAGSDQESAPASPPPDRPAAGRPRDATAAGRDRGDDDGQPFSVSGVRRLLAAVAPEEELERFHRATLGPLLAQDARQRGELSRTLEAYIECGGNTVQAAKRIRAHRNTVLYRLDRLRELLGVDLRDANARFVLQLALHAGAAAGATAASGTARASRQNGSGQNGARRSAGR